MISIHQLFFSLFLKKPELFPFRSRRIFGPYGAFSSPFGGCRRLSEKPCIFSRLWHSFLAEHGISRPFRRKAGACVSPLGRHLFSEGTVD